MENNKLSFNRFLSYFIIFMSLICGTLALGVIGNQPLDEMIIAAAVSACFILVYICYMVYRYVNRQLYTEYVSEVFQLDDGTFIKELPKEHTVKYLGLGKATVAVVISVVLTVAFSLLPDYCVPFMIICAILTPVIMEVPAIILSSYLAIMLCMCQNRGIEVLCVYLLAVFSGVMLCKILHEGKAAAKLFGYIILLCTNILLPVMAYYFIYHTMDEEKYIYALGCGLLSCVAATIILPRQYRSMAKANVDIYDEIVSTEYTLVKELEHFSEKEFDHALNVSRLCTMCAKEIGLNEKLAMAAGFYYRIGIINSTDIVPASLKIASEYSLPDDVVTILAEYYGQEKTISSQESALVNIVDAVVTTVADLKDNKEMTGMNPEMFIYQLVNDMSSKGLFDDSGLSMNKYLKIRDILIKEGINK